MEQSEDFLGLAEDWAVLKSFLPANWQELAVSTEALKGLRKDKSAENLLQVLLLHLGCGYSLQETAVRARRAQLADMTAAAVWNRLRKSSNWLRSMCVELFRERGLELAGTGGFQIRSLDTTTVQEPGRFGLLWRIHCSVRLPSLVCDTFKLTTPEGSGTGESFRWFPIAAGDYLLADHGYATAADLHHVVQAGAFATVPVDTKSLPLGTPQGGPFDLSAAVRGLQRPGQIGCWPVVAVDADGTRVSGRVCALRKTGEAIRLAHNALRCNASETGECLQAQALESAKYVILFTTFPPQRFPVAEVLEWYRMHWLVAPIYKRFKSLAHGHLPKYADESARAWFYGKLLVALLVEEMGTSARYSSPWGYRLTAASVRCQPMEEHEAVRPDL